ncbi:tRNA (adenosine(37)-N6)-dimethylallyltransferase MiaA [Gemella cuniculi]|uniref:tRNA (adenosine(37)-N6)-dimethylallyltransferase MiaA n=1 Tax=Gemella cuniculi TaxID=150240 RepID=UPI0003FD07B8|nr:tRNA (adenosine(37)-N6)-dimethylallyltransferase MiaA [Gemella cuniculi]
MKKIPLIVIVGPTAVGKTNLSIELAKKFNCEIISIDSVQIYKKFDVGSAKIKKEEMGGVVHHLIDELEPDDNCSVYDFQKMARNKIEDIYSRGKIPLLIGGTGFYMNAVLNNYKFSDLEEKIYDVDVDMAKNYLRENYLDTYNNIDLENRRRVINAYNYVINEKKSIMENNNGDKILEKYNPYLIVLNTDREVLYSRINKRVKLMFEQGLEGEVRNIISEYGTNLQALGAIGYKEMLPYLTGEVTKKSTIEKISQNSRRYAKRQLTWFRNKMNGVWYDVQDENFLSKVENDIKKNLGDSIIKS